MASLCQVTIWFGSDFCGLLCPLLLRQAAYLFAFPTFFTSVEAVMLCLNFLFSARLSWISSLLCCIFKLIWEQHDLDQATSRLPVPLAAGSRGVRSGVLKFSATYLMGFSDVCTSLLWSDRFNQPDCLLHKLICSQSELIFLYSIMLWLYGWLFCVWSVSFGRATEWRMMILWNFLCCCGSESIYVENDQPSLSSERFSEMFHP